MKINSIKLTVVTMLLSVLIGVLYVIFFVEIPEGNSRVAFTFVGIIGNETFAAIRDLFRKP